MTRYDAIHEQRKPEPLSGAEKRILLLTSPCHFLTHMFILVFPAVTIPVMTSLSMPLEQVVRLSFLMYLFYGLGALPAGYAADRWQARKLLIAGVYMMGLGLVLAGMAKTPQLMSLSLMIVGVGASIYHPAGLALISRTVRRRGHALAINGVWGNLGIASAPFITGLLTWGFSWRTAFVVLGSSSVVAGLLLTLIRVDESSNPVHKDPGKKSGEYMKYFLILCVALVMGGLTYRGNTVILPAYLELKTTFFRNLIDSVSYIKGQGTATLAATVLTSIVFLMGIFGQMLGGRLADRFDLRYAYLAVHAASVPFLLAMAWTTDYVLAACAAMYVFFSLGMQPIENSLVAALTPARWRSTSFAIKFILVFGVGAMAVYLVGKVKAAYSLEAVYVFLAAVAFLLVSSILGVIIASRKIHRIQN